MTTIIDYGMGNLGSVQNMLKKIGEPSIIASDNQSIKNATRILLPGVGSFDNAIKNLHKLDIFTHIKDKVLDEKVPIMGICLGMQLLTNGSEEGSSEGFGLIDAEAKKFHFTHQNKNLFIPHMGWNTVENKKESHLFQNTQVQNRFYFVHSYAIQCHNPQDILTTTKYGCEFTSGFEKENIIGFQFHPEKSHKFGMRLFQNFVEHYHA